MRILYVTPEVFPLVKTGGLADVAGALPKALRRLGVDVRLLVARLPRRPRRRRPARAVGAVADLPGGRSGRLLLANRPGDVPPYVLDAPPLYDRPGPYGTRPAATGRTTTCASRWAGPPPRWPARAWPKAGRRTSCTARTGRPALRRPMSALRGGLGPPPS